MSKTNFTRAIVAAAGIKVVRAGRGGRYGWTKLDTDGSLLFSGRTHRTEDEAFFAAHHHFNLRTA